MELSTHHSSPYALGFLVAIAAVIVAVVLFRVCGGGGNTVRRTAVLLMGLPNSGKTCLFSQLTTGVDAPTCTSMEINEGWTAANPNPSLPSSSSPQAGTEDGDGPASTSGKSWIIDHPGHRRLYPSLRETLRRAKKVVLVVDSVTIHDDRHEGAAAVAELLYSFTQMPEFYGVKALLIACTKRDELTSYSSKAVRKLLEVAMTTCIQSRRGELSQVDQVMDSKGVVVGKRGGERSGAGSGGRHFTLDLAEDESFSFEDHMPVPVTFADVSGRTAGDQDNVGFSVAPVLRFIASA